MSEAQVISIHIASVAAGPTRAVAGVRAVPGCGLEGDRYFKRAGTLGKNPKAVDPGRQATLIEIEAIEALQRDKSIALDPGESRRNIVTRGLALNHLVGCEFSVGEVRLRGIRLCEPCGHLEKLTQTGVRDGLVHRGGLRAEILSEGVIRVGDPVRMHHATVDTAPRPRRASEPEILTSAPAPVR